MSSVLIGGQKKIAMRLRLDAAKTAAHGVTIQDVECRLRADNIELSGGSIEDRAREISISTLGDLKTPELFERLALRAGNGALIRLADV